MKRWYFTLFVVAAVLTHIHKLEVENAGKDATIKALSKETVDAKGA